MMKLKVFEPLLHGSCSVFSLRGVDKVLAGVCYMGYTESVRIHSNIKNQNRKEVRI